MDNIYNSKYKHNTEKNGFSSKFHYDHTTTRLIKRYNKLLHYLRLSRHNLRNAAYHASNKQDYHFLQLPFKKARKVIYTLIRECSISISHNLNRQTAIRYEKVIKEMNVNSCHNNPKKHSIHLTNS